MKHIAQRKEIKLFLSKLQDVHRQRFQLMYATELLVNDYSIEAVNYTVDHLPDRKVSTAHRQAKATYYNLFTILKNSHVRESL